MKKRFAVMTVSSLLLFAVACNSVQVPQETSQTSDDGFQVLALTPMTGYLGQQIAKGAPQPIQVQNANQLNLAASGNLSVAGKKPNLVYINADLASSDLAQSAVVGAAKKQGLRFLVEGNNQLSSKNSALGRFTNSTFGFDGEATSFVVQASTEHEGFGVYPFNARKAALQDAEQVQLANAEDTARQLNSESVFLASIVRQDSIDDQPTSVTTNFSDKLTTTASKTTPSSGFVNGEVRWSPWRAIYNYDRTRRNCSATTPCVDYTGGQVTTVFGNPKFNVAKWYGSTKICGSPTIDLNVNCTAAYGRITQTTRGSEATIGGSTGVEVGVEVSGKAGIPLVAEGEVKASLKVTQTVNYGRTWTSSSSYTFSETDTVNIKGGYMARFGKGDWRVSFDTRINSRWERRVNEYLTFGQIGTYSTTNLRENDGSNQQCVNTNTGVIVVINQPPVKTADYRCTYRYRSNQNILHRYGDLTVLGADYWAICKQTDTTCVNTQINNAGATQFKL